MDCLRSIGEWIYHFQTLITGIAAVAAAIVTIWFVWKQVLQTEEYRREDEENKRKAALSTFAFKAHNIIDSITRNKRHIDTIKSKNPDVEVNDLWRVFLPTLSDQLPLERIGSKDFFALMMIKNPDLLQGAQELERANSTIHSMMDENRRLRHDLSQLIVGKTAYNNDGGNILGITTYEAVEGSEIEKKTFELSNLVRGIDGNINDAYERGKDVYQEINEMLKSQKIGISFEIPDSLDDK